MPVSVVITILLDVGFKRFPYVFVESGGGYFGLVAPGQGAVDGGGSDRQRQTIKRLGFLKE